MIPTLVIMAAGNSTRYGSLKQFEKVGAANAYLFEYAIYDAIEAGFKKVVFILKKEFQVYFKDIVSKLSQFIEIEFAFQLINFHEKTKKIKRNKPCGTGHALLSCKNLIHDPFVLMNADDYYGKTVFKLLYDQLYIKWDHQFMIGYELGKTLSENGSVNRGVCSIDKNGDLEKIEELENLNSKDHAGSLKIVSMNLWGFKPSVFNELEKMFIRFLAEFKNDPTKEYFLPTVVNEIIKDQKETFKVINTQEQWYGLTYTEDKMILHKALLHKDYPKELWKN